MSRLLYRCLLWLHPPSFRQQFAEEMLWIFDEESKQALAWRFADCLISLARQWLVRSGLWKLLPAAVGGLLTLAAGLALPPALRHGLDFIKLKPLERLFVLMAFPLSWRFRSR